MSRRPSGVRRFGVRHPSARRRENPKDGWWDNSSMFTDHPKEKAMDDYGRSVEKIKKTIHKNFGTCTYVAKIEEKNVEVKFKVPSMRAWMDGMLAMKKADSKRKHKWVPDMACSISDKIAQLLIPPYDDTFVLVYAMVDDTLPPEGKMTEQELEIIYGT